MTTARKSALRTIEIEKKGLVALEVALKKDLGDALKEAVTLILNAKGRAILTGMGKSGHVGQKIAATLASTGTPAFFVHPSEASHGDLGMIRKEDVIIAFSWSGETSELTNIISYSRRFHVPLIAVTSNPKSALGKNSDCQFILPKVDEACPHGLAPTTSTLMQLALGDALAIALLEARGFTPTDFKTFHPGGQLGAKLKPVKELMQPKENLPLATKDLTMNEALLIMTGKGFGCLGIIDNKKRLIGIITDGDLRRTIDDQFFEKTTSQIMTADPKTIGPNVIASTALDQLNNLNITTLFVVDEKQEPIGLLHIHDLLRAGVA